MRSRILVTGGAGFIGANFIRYLLGNNSDIQVVNLDLLTYAGSLENLKDLPNEENYAFIHGDICDQRLVENILREHAIDTIVNFAAESHVDRSILGPDIFVKTNIMGTFTLLEAARKIWLDEQKADLSKVRFHHISTDEVYGSLQLEDPAFREETPYSPNSPYAASKASSDHLVNSYFHTYGLPITITNCSNNYGPYQFPEKLIPLMILNAIEGKPLPVYGDGMQIRDWLYVEDHCSAIWEVIIRGTPGESYNVGGENQPANIEIIRSLCAILDETLPESPYVPHAKGITHVTDRPGHDRRYAMNISKIRADLSWEPRYTVEEGLRKTVAWYLSQEDWIAAIREQPDFRGWIKKNYSKRG